MELTQLFRILRIIQYVSGGLASLSCILMGQYLPAGLMLMAMAFARHGQKSGKLWSDVAAMIAGMVAWYTLMISIA